MATRTEWGEESLKNAIGAEGLGWVVCALNAHDDLAAALKRACDGESCYCKVRKAQQIEGPCWVCAARAALAKAEPEGE